MIEFYKAFFENGSTVYPQPVALSCGRILRARNIQEWLDAVLKCAETVTRYLAIVAISSFAAREEATSTSLNVLRAFTGNLSFGHFLSVIQGITSVDCTYPLKDTLTAAFKNKEGGSGLADINLIALLNLRNELGHDLMSLNEAKAIAISRENTPDQKLKTALEALTGILNLPLFVIEEQSLADGGRIVARRLLLMGESQDPVPEEITITAGFSRRRSLYIGLPEGALGLYPFLMWQIAEAKSTYSVYFIQSIPDKNLKYTTISSDYWEYNSDLISQLQKRLNGTVFPKETVMPKDSTSFLKEWLDRKRVIEQSRNIISGRIPWDDLKSETLRWYAKRLGAAANDTDEKIRRTISKQLFDGRDRLTPEEIQQVILLFGREKAIRKYTPRNLIDCRARKTPDVRWDERRESAENVIECLKLAIDFFGRHIAVAEETTLEGLSATSGSANYIAMREGLVNLFMHQDYEDQTTVAQIEITPDQTMFFNAGRSLVSDTALVDGGKSQSRNPLLSRALRLIGFAELAGSGLREVYRAWRTVRRRPPHFESDQPANTFTLTLDWRELPDISDEFWEKRLGVHISPQESMALLLASEPSGTNIEEIALAQVIQYADGKAIYQQLIRNVLVVEKEHRIYIQDHLKPLAEEAKMRS